MKRPEKIYTDEFRDWDVARFYAGQFISKYLEIPSYGRGLPFGINLLEIAEPEYYGYNILRRAIAHAVPESDKLTVQDFCSNLFNVEVKTPAQQLVEMIKGLSDEEKQKFMDL